MVSNPSSKVKSEEIDGVILRLLGLNPGTEIDYQTYHDILKKKLALARLAGKELPREEDELLREEFKRVRKEKNKGIRIKVKKAKIKTSSIPPSGPGLGYSGGGGGGRGPSGAIVKSQRGKIVPQNIIISNTKDIKQVAESINFSGIKNTLDSILSVLSSKFKFDQKQKEQDRKEKESEKRSKGESALEGFKKGVAGIVATTKKMLSPFQEVIDRIWRFIFFTLLGRAFTNFMEWMSDKQNKQKFDSFIEFLTDHWPALAGLYILFGTSFGKLVRGLLKGVARMTVALIANLPKIRKFITKYRKTAFIGAAIASAASGYLSREMQDLFGDKETPESGLIPSTNSDLTDTKKDIDKAKNTRIPTANTGGMIPSFIKGGFNPFGGMNLSEGVPITGAGKDDTLIAAKTGEAILTDKDQIDLNQRYVDRETGEPLNIPQYLSGRTPGSVRMGNIKFPGFGGGFFDGGMISKFNTGGIVGGVSNVLNSLGGIFTGRKAKAVQTKPNVSSWFGPAPIPDYRTPEARALLKTIRTAEHYSSTKNPYNTLYGGGTAPITQMTVKEVIDMYDTKRLPKRLGGGPANYGPGSGAAGAYQFMPFTLEDLIRRGVVKPNQIMVPDLQDRLAWDLASAVRGLSVSGLRKSGLTQSSMDKIAPEWASFPYSGRGGASYYGQPVKDSNFLKDIYQRSLPGKNGGGLIKSTSGVDVSGSVDTQAMRLQIGEYVLPLDFVNKVGVSALDSLVAYFDKNSTPFKNGALSRIPKITPYNASGMDGMITLPPIVQGGGTKARSSGYGGGSRIPSFSFIPEDNDRATNASIYGIVSVA